MKIIKKYGIYVLLSALAVTLILLGSQNIDTPDSGGITYVPKPIVEMDVEKPEPLTVNAPVKAPKTADENKPELPKSEKPVTKHEEPSKPIEQPKPTEQSKPLAFGMPVKGEICGEYSDSKMVYSDTTKDFRAHNGIDISAAEGTDVSAAAYGAVKAVSSDILWGTSLTVDHGGGLESRYCGLSECFVSEGSAVDYGTVIGKVGSGIGLEAHKGTHLHFEATMNGKHIDPQTLFY